MLKSTQAVIQNPKVLHISAECYPAAKAGGLADVVGALPKYLNKLDHESQVIIPKYHTPWILRQEWEQVFDGQVYIGYYNQPYKIERLTSNELGFELMVIDLPWKFDRPGIYADPSGHFYGDGPERFICFQRCVLHWLVEDQRNPEVLHCHDHHTGLIPFLIKYCAEYQNLQETPTLFTIHNGRYHGSFGWNKQYLLPYFDQQLGGLIEWDNAINPLAAGIKNATRVTTVSRAYLEELKEDSNGLEWLLREEAHKSTGILNGIDTEVWDPTSDPALHFNLKKSVPYYKRKNRDPLIQTFGLNKKLPLVSFIGRFAREKGADVLPSLVERVLSAGLGINLLMLGSGDQWVQDRLNEMRDWFPGRYNTYIGYNEALAHQIYAGSDYLLMPSRVEPCGLNQMYALRYGTIPIVRRTGGLNDSVVDIGDPSGSGIMFNYVSVDDIWHALYRAEQLFYQKEDFQRIVQRNMNLDFSWERSAATYIEQYDQAVHPR